MNLHTYFFTHKILDEQFTCITLYVTYPSCNAQYNTLCMHQRTEQQDKQQKLEVNCWLHAILTTKLCVKVLPRNNTAEQVHNRAAIGLDVINNTDTTSTIHQLLPSNVSHVTFQNNCWPTVWEFSTTLQSQDVNISCIQIKMCAIILRFVLYRDSNTGKNCLCHIQCTEQWRHTCTNSAPMQPCVKRSVKDSYFRTCRALWKHHHPPTVHATLDWLWNIPQSLCPSYPGRSCCSSSTDTYCIY